MIMRSSGWMHSTEDLLNILRCRYDEITLPMLGEAFLKRGWLTWRSCWIQPTDRVGLGDIGYVDDAGSFVFVDNVHDLHGMEGQSGTLFWKWDLRFRSGDDVLEDTPAEIIFSQAGNAYQRRRQVHFPICLCLLIYFRLFPLAIPARLYTWIDLAYDNPDESHAWKWLQHHAHSIITSHGLSIASHELKLGQCHCLSSK